MEQEYRQHQYTEMRLDQGLAIGNKSPDNQDNDDYRGERRNDRDFLGQFRQMAVEHDPCNHWQQHDRDHVDEQVPLVNLDIFTGEQAGEQRRCDNRDQSRGHGHRHRQRQIGIGEIGDNIGGGAAGTAGDEDQAHGKACF